MGLTIDHFSYGWVNPALAYVMSVVGCLLGIMLATKARRRTGRHRVRLLTYATITFGGIGIWLAQTIALLGVTVPPAVVRYAPGTLALSLAVALVDVGTGLFLICRGPLSARQLIPGGVVIGLGATATSFTVMVSLRATADLSYDPVRFGITAGLCVLLAPCALWSLAALRGLTPTVVSAGLLGLVICGIHYGGQWSLMVQPRQSTSDVDGLTGPMLMPPLILGGVTAAAMLAYFTIGSSTLRELRAIYSPHEEPEHIDAWLIEEVTTRVINGTSFAPLPANLEPVRPAEPRRRRPRPFPSARPSWNTARGVVVLNHDSVRNDGRYNRYEPRLEPVILEAVDTTPEPQLTPTGLPRRVVAHETATPTGPDLVAAGAVAPEQADPETLLPVGVAAEQAAPDTVDTRDSSTVDSELGFELDDIPIVVPDLADPRLVMAGLVNPDQSCVAGPALAGREAARTALLTAEEEAPVLVGRITNAGPVDAPVGRWRNRRK
jgi:NO-binding membrane sensor protein with MHYT domain